MNLDFENKDTPIYKSKMRSDDRILVLKTMDGKKPTNSQGLTDPRLFTGENKLHCIRGPFDSLWRFKAQTGLLPEPMKGTFTNFDKALDFAQNYFRKRNVEIKEVVDDYTSSYA